MPPDEHPQSLPSLFIRSSKSDNTEASLLYSTRSSGDVPEIFCWHVNQASGEFVVLVLSENNPGDRKVDALGDRGRRNKNIDPASLEQPLHQVPSFVCQSRVMDPDPVVQQPSERKPLTKFCQQVPLDKLHIFMRGGNPVGGMSKRLGESPRPIRSLREHNYRATPLQDLRCSCRKLVRITIDVAKPQIQHVSTSRLDLFRNSERPSRGMDCLKA